MPAEWAPHARTWMAWPRRPESWNGAENLDMARRSYADVARAIARYEPVTMLASPEQVAGASLACGSTVAVMPMPLNDSWVRDNGPVFVTDGKGGVAGTDWVFDGYGGLSGDFADDAAVPERLLGHLGMRRYAVQMVLEGGAVCVDGEGTLIATESVLLNERRNPGMDRKAVEAMLAENLGVHRVVWLAGGLDGDTTQGHVRLVAAFARPGVVMAHVAPDKADVNHAMLAENLNRLKNATDARGRVLDIVPVPLPTARRDGGRRLPLSYLSAYIANGAVIVPAFDEARDTEVAALYREQFPGREVILMDADDVFAGGSGFHAIALGQPAGEALT